MDTVLKIGVGRQKITPPLGTLLMGYAPARPAESVHDDLLVTALAFQFGPTKAMLISADVCVLKHPLSEQLRDLVSQSTGVPVTSIILAATHTHSGPAMRATPGGAPADERYINNVFQPGVIKAAVDAVNSMQPAQVGIGTTTSHVGINRRELDKAGQVILGQNPWGCFDPVMTVIGFRNMAGKPIANLIHYGAHCTAAGRNPEITRDWAGPMVDRMEAVSGAVTVFFNGAEGDSGPRLTNGKTTGNIQLAMELGSRAAFDAIEAYKGILEYRDMDLKVSASQIHLPYASLPEADDLEKALSDMGDPEHLTGLKVMAYEALLARRQFRRTGVEPPTHLTLDQTIVCLGPVAFVPFPFEIFSEITLRLRAHSPYPHTLSLSNANGSYFYFVSQDQICRGGYEVWVFHSMNVHSLADYADDALVSENLRLLEPLFQAH